MRPVAASDAEQIVAAINNLAVSRWLTVVPYPYLLSDALWFIGENMAGRINARSIWFGDRLIGNIDCDSDLGYWLAAPYWGQGFATEAAKAVLTHVFAAQDVDEIGSGYFADNRASANVLRKLGFEKTGLTTMPSAALQKDMPSQRVNLTRASWEARNA